MACVRCGQETDPGQVTCGGCGQRLQPGAAPRGGRRSWGRWVIPGLLAAGGGAGLLWTRSRTPASVVGPEAVAQAQVRMDQQQRRLIEAERRAAPVEVRQAPPAPAPGTPAEATPVALLVQVPPRVPPGAGPVLRRGPVDIRLRIHVDDQGRPQRAEFLLAGSGPFGRAFEREAERAALASTYRPAMLEGRPCAGTLDLTYRFR